MNEEILTLDRNLSIPSYPEIREEIVKDMQTAFGSDLATDPGTPDGQLIDLVSYAWSLLAQKLQGAIADLDPNSATGSALDRIASFTVGGRAENESDVELRNRILTMTLSGLATYDGMLTYLRRNVSTGVALLVNDEPYTDATTGQDGHSVAVFVPSGTGLSNDEIAQEIWTCKPAGIRTSYITDVESGNKQTGTVLDASGMAHTLKFMLSVQTGYYLKIEITEYKEEELPDTYETDIADAVKTWAADEFIPGKDIIWKRFATPIFSVSGVLDFSIYYKTNESGEWTLAGNNISVNGYDQVIIQDVSVELKE